MLRLHDFLPSGNGYKVRLLLGLLGRPVEIVPVDILKGESRTAAFLARNPNGRVPVLELENGEFLAESDAILFYLAEGTRFLPEGRLARARVLQWLFFEQYSHEPHIATSRFWHMTGQAEAKARQLAEKRAPGEAALRVMERHLANRAVFVGDTWSIADIALYAYTHVADEGGFPLDPYPAIRRWMAELAAQPGYIGDLSLTPYPPP